MHLGARPAEAVHLLPQERQGGARRPSSSACRVPCAATRQTEASWDQEPFLVFPSLWMSRIHFLILWDVKLPRVV